MKYRELGRTGIQVSEIGFGAWGIGGATPGATSYGTTDDRISLAALHEALAQGVTFYDTSSVYGYGHSEELLGKAFSSRRDKVVIATKAGLSDYGRPADFSPAAIKKSIDESLRRLNSDYVDLLQLHNPPLNIAAELDGLRRLAEDLKATGKIRAFGMSVRMPEDGAAILRQMPLDALQLNFNLLDQRAKILFGTAQAAGCSVIARTPLCFGFLTGAISKQTIFAADDHRSRWSKEQIDRWIDGAAMMLATMDHPERQTPSQYALRFCLSFPAVAAAIPGMLRPEEVAANVAACHLGPLADSELTAVAGIYDGNEFFIADSKPVDPGKLDRPLVCSDTKDLQG